VCARLPALAPRTRVLILQHPKERRVAIGTAAMAARCLAGSAVVVGTHVDAHPTVAAALADPTRRPVLLWPGPDAIDVAEAPPRDPVTLFVVDGTWSTAKKLLVLNPAVAALPRYRIAPASPSEYRIRREPRAECLSTIEAIANALGVLEGDPAPYRAMLTPFRTMVDTQIDYQVRVGRPRDKSRLRRRVRPVWAPPPALRDPSHVVVVAAETNAWPIDAKDRHPDEIVHWLAARGDGTDAFELVVRPTHPLAPSVTSHTRLAAEVLLAGAPRAELHRAFAAFLRSDDAIASWGSYATDLMRAEGMATGHPTVDLRRVAANWLKASPGSMERCAARLGLTPPVLGQGRGGIRVGFMRGLYQAMLAPRARDGALSKPG
jgi:DTW domain-containing protein YfiP